MIVVFGATGNIGGEVLRQLTERGAPVRAVARTEAKAAALRTGSVEAVVADLSDPASLAGAIEGADHVFVATPGSAQQVELEGNLVDALAGKDVHLVKLAALGYDAVPAEQAIALSAGHARVVAHIRERGIDSTVVAPSGFMTNLLMSAGTIQQGQLYASAGDGGVAWIDPGDIAAVVVHVLTTAGHVGASYNITGPQVLTYADLVERLSAATGHEVAYVDVPAEQFGKSLQDAGLDAWLANALTELNQVYRAHQAEVVTDEVDKATGRPARSFDEWLKDNLAAFTA